MKSKEQLDLWTLFTSKTRFSECLYGDWPRHSTAPSGFIEFYRRNAGGEPIFRRKFHESRELCPASKGNYADATETRIIFVRVTLSHIPSPSITKLISIKTLYPLPRSTIYSVRISPLHGEAKDADVISTCCVLVWLSALLVSPRKNGRSDIAAVNGNKFDVCLIPSQSRCLTFA